MIKDILFTVITVFNYIVLVYFTTLNIWYFVLNLIAYNGLKGYLVRLKVVSPNDKVLMNSAPPVTLLTPAFNESQNCVKSVHSQLKIKYPDMRILFINDGSTDDTLEKMLTTFKMEPAFLPKVSQLETKEVKKIYQSQLYPKLWLIDKENGKKADALNVGINYCQTPLFCAIDNDSMLEEDSIARVVVPFIEDVRTIVSGGIIRIANGCKFENGHIQKVDLPKNIWARFQVMEYLRAFYGGRLAWDKLDASLIVSGAFGVFRHSIVVAAGGYLHETIGEDMELIVRLHRYCGDNHIPYKIRYLPDPIAWTEGPTTLKTLGKQRDRWQRGLLDSVMRHIKMLFRPKYKKVGILAMPFYFIYEMIGPFIEIAGYIAFFALLISGNADTTFIVVFLLVSVVMGMCLSVFTLVLEEISFHRYPKFKHMVNLIFVAIIENLGYRQLNSWWRIKGTWSYLKKIKTGIDMKKIIIISMVIISLLCSATVDYEALHEKGRILYQTGSDREALDVYQEILNNYPDDVDALLFRGRLFARLELYDLAEAELIHTLELAPEYHDAYYALASVYYWTGRLNDAARILTLWIELDFENPDAYILSARVAIAGRKYAAARTFLELAEGYQADPDIIETLLSLINTPQSNTDWAAGIRYEYVLVDQGRPNWQQIQANITHDFNKILVTAEFNRYQRNDTYDHTFVLDTYYKLWKKAYMNTRFQAGLSGTFMPIADVTAEVFQAVGTRHEPSLGYRLMYYDSTAAHITSVAWAMYPGKWYLRDKVSLIINDGLSWQNQISVRYFLNDVDTYIQLMNVVGTDFNVFNNEWMQSVAFALSGSFVLGDNILLFPVLSWTIDEYNLNRFGGTLGLTYRW